MNSLLWNFPNNIHKSNISWPFDPYPHKFFISVKFLSLTDGSLSSAVLWSLLRGGTWIGKCNNSHCFIQNYQKVSRSCILTFRMDGHWSLSKEKYNCNSSFIIFNCKNNPVSTGLIIWDNIANMYQPRPYKFCDL